MVYEKWYSDLSDLGTHSYSNDYTMMLRCINDCHGMIFVRSSMCLNRREHKSCSYREYLTSIPGANPGTKYEVLRISYDMTLHIRAGPSSCARRSRSAAGFQNLNRCSHCCAIAVLLLYCTKCTTAAVQRRHYWNTAELEGERAVAITAVDRLTTAHSKLVPLYVTGWCS